MKKLLTILCVTVFLASASPWAQAGERWSVSISGNGVGGYYSSNGNYGVYYASPRYYVAPGYSYCPPAPSYQVPTSYYYATPVFVVPQSAYYYSGQPQVYFAPTYYVRPQYSRPHCW